MNLNMTPYSVASRFASGGDCYPSQANFPSLQHAFHRDSGVTAASWTDMINGLILNATIAAGGADGSITVSGSTGFTGTLKTPKAGRCWAGILVLGGATAGSFTIGTSDLGGAQVGLCFQKTESASGFALFIRDAAGANYVSSGNAGAVNTMAYTNAAGSRALVIDYPDSAVTRIAATHATAAAEAWEIDADAVGTTGTVGGTPFASGMADAADLPVTMNGDQHAFFVFDWASKPANLLVGLEWMSADGNRGRIYPGWRGL